MTLATGGLLSLLVGLSFYAAHFVRRFTLARDVGRDEVAVVLRREYADLLTHRDETSNWSDAWRERYLTEHWNEYADPQAPVLLREKALELEARLRSGFYRDHARRIGASLRLTSEQVADLELIYQREAQEPMKQYRLIMARKKKALEEPA